MDAKRKVILFIISFAMIFSILTSPFLVNATSIPVIIPVGRDPQGITYDPGTDEMYVANFDSNTVSVISDSTNTVVATIEVGTQPKNIAYDSGKGEMFVTNWGSGTVSVISDKTHSVVATIPVGNHPVGIAYDSAKSEIFVANSGDNTVSVISDTNNSVVATIATGTNLLNGSSTHGLGDPHPIGVTYDSATNEIYVVNSYPDSSGSGTVSVISDSNNSVIVSIPVGELPHYAAYDPRRGEIFVTNLQDNFVSVISDTTYTVIASVTLPKGNGNSGITYDSKTSEMFVLNMRGTVNVISDSSVPWLRTVSTYNVTLGIGGNCFGIAYNAAKESVFVANAMNNSVSILSISSPSTTASTYPTPSVPEFPLIIVIILIVTLTSAIPIFKRPLFKNHINNVGISITSKI